MNAPDSLFAESDSLTLPAAGPFSWSECLAYLGRSDVEIMHRLRADRVYKAIEVKGTPVLLELTAADPGDATASSALRIRFPEGLPTPEIASASADYVREWFGLDEDLAPFYALARRDRLLDPVVSAHKGLRLIGIPDLFEALVWSITGQQISLGFAYTMKKRLVERYGEPLPFHAAPGEQPLRLFPTPARLAALAPGDLRPMQFSGRKAEYIIGIAKMMEEGRLDKTELLRMDETEAREALLAVRGVGAWTADYVGMKCLRRLSAFPVADAGLHQALKRSMNLDRKPLPAEIADAAEGWRGWEAYATFYLWQSLL